MPKIAFLFPGQGSQKVGMGRDLFENSTSARQVFESADRVLGFKLSALMFDGPKEELQKTSLAQPAILTHSIAVLRTLLEKKKIEPSILAGHSLGEYSALVAASSIKFEAAVKAVHFRGQAMQRAVADGQGAMAVVLGLLAKDIIEVCKQVSNAGLHDYVAVANLNGPEQTVISGTKEGVLKASALLKNNGAKRILPLPVSAPFHCDMMKPAADELQTYLANLSFADAEIPLISNVTAEFMTDKASIPRLLVSQVTSSVRFTDVVSKLNAEKIVNFIEIGPGKALSGIVKRMISDAQVCSVSDLSSIDQLLSNL